MTRVWQTKQSASNDPVARTTGEGVAFYRSRTMRQKPIPVIPVWNQC